MDLLVIDDYALRDITQHVNSHAMRFAIAILNNDLQRAVAQARDYGGGYGGLEYFRAICHAASQLHTSRNHGYETRNENQLNSTQ